MRRFTDSIRKALTAQDWYGALSTAVTLPDVCGRLENPTMKSQERYVHWFNAWLKPEYTSVIGAGKKEHTFLHGEDCYALRCSYLHEGGSNIEEQKAQVALTNFHFITPPPTGSVHCNQVNNVLQLQVDIFCNQIAAAVDRWAESVTGDTDIQQRMRNLLVIHDSSRGIRF